MDNYIRKALVTRIIDGDTVVCEVSCGYHIKTTETFRLLGIDTPELKGDTHEKGLEAKNFTISQILNKEVYIESYKTDSFKRWLGKVYYKNENNEQLELCQVLLDKGLAAPYMV